jgi:hypothetical protein
MNRLQKFVEQGAYGGGSGAQRSPLANVCRLGSVAAVRI